MWSDRPTVSILNRPKWEESLEPWDQDQPQQIPIKEREGGGKEGGEEKGIL
jgi:hypothetical protein